MDIATWQKGEAMSDLMTFPDTVEEFMERYKVIDTMQVYTNGAELVPIFRMKQWFEHLLTAEPRTGKWVPYEFGDERWHKCTACGTADMYKTRVERDNGEVHYLTAVRNYCPHCGAMMEESDE
jgi:hypothetical protein